MNHTWEKLPDSTSIGVGKFKEWKCKVCGCRKSLGYYKFAEPHYQRSGINYDGYVGCIDMEAENLKTID